MTAPAPQCQPKDTELRQFACEPPWINGVQHNGDPELIFCEGQAIADCGFSADSRRNLAHISMILEAVNSHAILKARVEELEAALRDAQNWLRARADDERHPVKKSVFAECHDHLARAALEAKP